MHIAAFAVVYVKAVSSVPFSFCFRKKTPGVILYISAYLVFLRFSQTHIISSYLRS